MDVKLTRRGRRALKAGLDGLSPGATLLTEVMAHVDYGTATGNRTNND
jgi:hypothetical protein